MRLSTPVYFLCPLEPMKTCSWSFLAGQSYNQSLFTLTLTTRDFFIDFTDPPTESPNTRETTPTTRHTTRKMTLTTRLTTRSTRRLTTSKLYMQHSFKANDRIVTIISKLFNKLSLSKAWFLVCVNGRFKKVMILNELARDSWTNGSNGLCLCWGALNLQSFCRSSPKN